MSFTSLLCEPAPCAPAVTACDCTFRGRGNRAARAFVSAEDALIANDTTLSFDPSGSPTIVTLASWSGPTRITYRVSTEPNGASRVTLQVVVTRPSTGATVYSNIKNSLPLGAIGDDVIVPTLSGDQVRVQAINTATGGAFTVLHDAVLTIAQL